MDTVLRWLFEAEHGFPSWPYLLLFVFFGVLAIGGGVLFLYRRRLFPGHPLHVQLAARFSPIAIAIGAAGLLLLILRYAGVPYVSARVLMLLAVLAGLAYLGYVAYFLRTRYRSLLSAQHSEQARQRYAPAQKTTVRRHTKKRHR